MAKTKKQKEEILEKLREEVKNRALIFVNYTFVKSEDLFNLRERLEKAGIKFMVVKNTLLKLALKSSGVKIEEEILDLPLAVAFATDEIESSKIIWAFANENEKLKILGGLIDNSFVKDDKIRELAFLPSKEELYVRLLGAVLSPQYRLINALSYNQIKLINILRSKNG